MMSLQVSLMASPSLVFGDDFSNRVTIDSDAIYLDRMEQLDCIVIGGGILGLSVARTIIEKNGSIRVAVLEKEDDWARHQSGRNSGVIHSGLYYKPGSLKAKLCREGNRRMVEFCDIHGIPYEVCRKVIVATMMSELPRLDNLYGRGIANGLELKK